MNDEHIPVLLDAVVAALQPTTGGRYIDGTVGAGGHSRRLLDASAPDGRLLAFDRDPEAIAFARQRLAPYGERVTFVNASYATAADQAPAHGFDAVDGILLDLGLSSRQLDDGLRGFSFRFDAPLDMRFDPTTGPTAADLVNGMPESALADIFWRFGEERHSRRIARAIAAARPIHTTQALAKVVAAARPGGRRRRIHPATQVFQALRIAVNEELVQLEQGLAGAMTLLRPGGRLAVISFHSLEDRLVKQTFRDLSRECICPPQQPICTCDHTPQVSRITRKAIQAGDDEVKQNPRSRSARLRVVEKRTVQA